jgi:hypothetical protein
MLNIGRGFPRVIGRGRRREHPMDTSERITWPSVITNVAQLPVPYTQENPEGIKWPGSHLVALLLLLRKKRGEKAGHAQNLLPVRAACGRPLLVTWRCHFRSKGQTMAYIAQLPVAHAHTIYFRTWSFSVTWLTSLPVMSLPITWLPVAPPQMQLCPYPYTTPAYWAGAL